VHVSPDGHRVAGRTASGGLLYAVKFGVVVTPPLSFVGGGGGGERGWTAAAGRHRRRRKRASTTAGRSGSGVAVGAAARRRADVGGKGLFWIATRVVSRGNGRGGASTPPAVDPLVRPAYAQSAPTPRVRGSGVVAGCLRAMARLPRCFLVTAVAAVGTAATAKLCIQ